jgi:hypothetical protein
MTGTSPDLYFNVRTKVICFLGENPFADRPCRSPAWLFQNFVNEIGNRDNNDRGHAQQYRKSYKPWAVNVPLALDQKVNGWQKNQRVEQVYIIGYVSKEPHDF